MIKMELMIAVDLIHEIYKREPTLKPHTGLKRFINTFDKIRSGINGDRSAAAYAFGYFIGSGLKMMNSGVWEGRVELFRVFEWRMLVELMRLDYMNSQ